MLGRQMKILEALQRAVQFVKSNTPPNANAKYAEIAGEFERVVAELGQGGGDQETCHRMGRATTQQ